MSNHERSHEAKYEAKDLSKDKKKGKKALIAAVATGVLVLGVGGAIFANQLSRSSVESNNNSTSQQTTETETTPSGPQIPEKAESYGGIEQGLEGEELTKAFEIQAGLSNEEYAKAFINRKDAWAMYGSTPELAKQYWGEAGDSSTTVTIDKISKDNTASIRKALFSDITKDTPGNPSKTLLEKFVSYMTDVNKFTLGIWVRTIPYPEVNPENKEAYTRTTSIDSIVDESEYAPNRTRSIEITVTEKENVDKNSAQELNAGRLGSEGKKTIYTVTTVTENGIEKISGIVQR